MLIIGIFEIWYFLLFFFVTLNSIFKLQIIVLWYTYDMYDNVLFISKSYLLFKNFALKKSYFGNRDV
jgi:hypothetical protein